MLGGSALATEGLAGRKLVIQGNEACVEAAIVAGCRFYAGYPITPASEIMEGMARRLPEVGGVFLQMEDEIAAINALVGASWGGWKAMTATSGPGFSLMQEAIGLAAITETPLVIVDVQRGGPASGQSTSPSQGDVFQARYGSNGDYAIVALAPSTAQEMFDLTVLAFNLSEQLRVPAVILSDEIVAHTREKVIIPPRDCVEVVDRKRPRGGADAFPTFRPDEDGIPPMPAFNEGYRLRVLSQVHNIWGERATPAESEELIRRLSSKVESRADQVCFVDTEAVDGAELIVVSYGSVARSALRAVRDARARGLPVGWVKLKTLWPFPQRFISQAVGHAACVLVPEMNLGRMALEVERVVKSGPRVVPLPKVSGQCHTPAEILAAIEGELKRCIR